MSARSVAVDGRGEPVGHGGGRELVYVERAGDNLGRALSENY